MFEENFTGLQYTKCVWDKTLQQRWTKQIRSFILPGIKKPEADIGTSILYILMCDLTWVFITLSNLVRRIGQFWGVNPESIKHITVSSSDDGQPLISSLHQADDFSSSVVLKMTSSSSDSTSSDPCSEYEYPFTRAKPGSSLARRAAITPPIRRMWHHKSLMACWPSHSRRGSTNCFSPWWSKSWKTVFGTPFSQRLMMVSTDKRHGVRTWEDRRTSMIQCAGSSRPPEGYTIFLCDGVSST